MTHSGTDIKERDGGRWALSGFLYQAVALGGLVAHCHDVGDPDVFDADLSALVEINGIIPDALYDQDGVVTGPLENQCVFYQVKFSGSNSTQVLVGSDFIEIIKSFLTGFRRASRDGKEVQKYVLVTNRSLNTCVNDWIRTKTIEQKSLDTMAKSIEAKDRAKGLHTKQSKIKVEISLVMERFDPSIVTWTLQSCIDKIANYGKRFGLFDEQISLGVERLIGRQAVSGGRGRSKPLDRESLKDALTGCSNPRELTSQAIQAQFPPDISPIYPEDLGALAHRDTVTSRLDRSVDKGNALIILVGLGGMGKSAALAKWVAQMLKDRPEAIIAVQHARNIEHGWIAKVIRGWSGIPGLFGTDDAQEALGRLRLANQESPFTLYLILDGIDETGDDTSGVVRRLLSDFAMRQRNFSTGQSPDVVLIATCRDKQWLGDFLDTSSLAPQREPDADLVEVYAFNDDEFRFLVTGLPTSNAKKKLLDIANSSASPTSGFIGINDGFTALTSYQEGWGSMIPIKSGGLDQTILDSLHHPVLWNRFSSMDDSTKEALLNKESNGLSDFGRSVFKWYYRKLDRRLGDKNLHQEIVKSCLVDVALSTEDEANPQKSVWIDTFKMKMSHSDAYRLMDEAASAGLIEKVGESGWKWSHQLVRESLASLRTETQ